MATLREVEQLAIQLKNEVEELRSTDIEQQGQLNTLTSAVDRMTLAVLGDDSLGVKGLIKTVGELQNESMSTKLAKAKWAGAGVVVIMVARGLWEVGANFINK